MEEYFQRYFAIFKCPSDRMPECRIVVRSVILAKIFHVVPTLQSSYSPLMDRQDLEACPGPLESLHHRMVARIVVDH